MLSHAPSGFSPPSFGRKVISATPYSSLPAVPVIEFASMESPLPSLSERQTMGGPLFFMRSMIPANEMPFAPLDVPELLLPMIVQNSSKSIWSSPFGSTSRMILSTCLRLAVMPRFSKSA